MSYNVIWSPKAKEDIEDINEAVNPKLSTLAAEKKKINKLLNKLKILTEHPLIPSIFDVSNMYFI